MAGRDQLDWYAAVDWGEMKNEPNRGIVFNGLMESLGVARRETTGSGFLGSLGSGLRLALL